VTSMDTGGSYPLPYMVLVPIRLLLKVLSMNGSDEDKMADALTRLAGLDPSSPLVLQLVQSLIGKVIQVIC
jgi:hypothetical protein